MRTPRLSLVLAASGAIALTAGLARAQVRWHQGPEVAPAAMAPDAAAATIADLVSDGTTGHVIVRLSRPVDSALRRQLADAGVTLGAPLGAGNFFAHADARRLDAKRLGAIAGLDHARAIEIEHKLHPLLAAGEIAEWSIVEERLAEGGAEPEYVVGAYVMMHRDVPLDEAVAMLEASGATVRDEVETINTLVVELPASMIETLAARDEVQWIEPPLPRFDVNNNSCRTAVQAGLAQSPPYDLDGTGVVALVYDGGTALAGHSDFGGRVTTHDGSGTSDHATHVCGTVGGDGTGSAGLYAGMAPNVTIVSYGFEYDGSGTFLYTNPGDIESNYSEAINTHSADVANNSIGSNVESNFFDCALQGDYGVTSALIDSIVRGDLGDYIRIQWSAGNERGGDRCDVEGFGDYYSTAPPACAKNHLTIGAMNSNDNSVTSFTSWGPTEDGRLKPDICGPGCQSDDDGTVTSCSSSGGYTGKCGTSMSSPVATGCAALLLQDYRDQFPGQPDYLPSTNKVLFVQTALDLQNTGPDYQTGYGMIHVKEAIDFMRGGSFLEGLVGQSEVHSFDVEVTSAVPELRVTLAWDDAPGTPNVIPSLVNDLDLLVTGPGGTHFPWTLDPLNPGAPAVRTAADHLNNIEQVVIDNPALGTYTISITGFDVPVGPQSYSIAASEALPPLVTTNVLPVNLPDLVPPHTPVTLSAQIASINEELVPDSAQVFYRYAVGSFSSVAMSNVGGNDYEAVLPAPPCEASVEFYFQAEGAASGVHTTPADAPASTFGFEVGEIVGIFEDDFESDMGWTASDNGATDGFWTRGVPVNCNRGDPPVDADGSGQCYLTNNSDANACNTDVDDGAVTLTSPLMDASDPDAVLAYWRWYNNVWGSNPGTNIFVVEISDDGGGSWTNLETIGPSGEGTTGGWVQQQWLVSDIPGITNTSAMRIRFTASDPNDGTGSVVEAAVDGVTITKFQCDEVQPPCFGDLTGPAGTPDGNIDSLDFLLLIGQWGSPCVGSCEADITGPGGNPDGNVDSLDFLLLISQWGSPANCAP